MTIDIAKARALCIDWSGMQAGERDGRWRMLDFACAARTLLPEALDEVERLRAQNQAAVETLRHTNAHARRIAAENARLRRALDAAGIVLGSDE